MTVEQLKTIGDKAEAQTIIGALKRIEEKLDTVISNQSSSGSGGSSGDDDDTPST